MDISTYFNIKQCELKSSAYLQNQGTKFEHEISTPV